MEEECVRGMNLSWQIVPGVEEFVFYLNFEGRHMVDSLIDKDWR